VNPSPASEPECDPNSLRAAGWRQGCLLASDLPLFAVGLSDSGTDLREIRTSHGVWLLANQDCDLSWTHVGQPESTLELRPVFTDSPPKEWGIRGRKLLLSSDSSHLVADSARLHVSPPVIMRAEHLTCLLSVNAQAVKTWLGLRYDRPAIAPEWLPLYQALSEAVRAKPHKALASHVRDVLVNFSETDGMILFGLIAVLPSSRTGIALGSLKDQLRAWLREICLKIPTELGVAESVEVGSTNEISFDLVENSFALDVSYATWPAKSRERTGEARP